MPATTTTHPLWPARQWRSRQVTRTHLAGIALLAGMASVTWAAYATGRGAGEKLGRLDGICLALDMAMGHGHLDDVQRRITTRALTLSPSPEGSRIPIRYRDLQQHCQELGNRRWSTN